MTNHFGSVKMCLGLEITVLRWRLKLKQLCEIRIGLVLSRRKNYGKKSAIPNYKAFTLSSIDSYGNINFNKLESFAAEPIEERYIAKEGDIILRLPEPNYAVYIDSKKEGIVIPSLFLCLKVKSDIIMPEYLVWLFNDGLLDREIDLIRAGTSIKTINTGQLANIDIKIISLERQKAIIEYSKLATREAMLREMLAEKRKLINRALLQQIYRGGSR